MIKSNAVTQVPEEDGPVRGKPTDDVSDLTDRSVLMQDLRGYIPLENQNIYGLNLYFDGKSHSNIITKDGNYYSFGVSLFNEIGINYQLIPLKKLPKPPKTIPIEEQNIFFRDQYKPVLVDMILRINRAIEDRQYCMKVKGLKITYFSIVNEDGPEDRLI